MSLRLALKIDVDTDRGTREGVPALLADCQEFGVPACFLFSLGPDQTGRAITRIFRPGFFQKVSRTSVVSLYGVRTLLNGTLLPAPHIEHTEGDLFVYFRHADVMALGDDYTTDYPAINPLAGGSSQGAIDNFNAALAMSDASTRFVPGHGQISTRQDLIDLRDAVLAIRERIRAMVAKGQSLEQVKAARPSREWDARFAMENVGHNDIFSTDRWYNIMYAEAQQYDRERHAN